MNSAESADGTEVTSTETPSSQTPAPSPPAFLVALHARVLQARSPESLFSVPAEMPKPGSSLAASGVNPPVETAEAESPEALAEYQAVCLADQMRFYSLEMHPERHTALPESTRLATEGYLCLQRLYAGALRKLERGTFGDPLASFEPAPDEVDYCITTPRGRYQVTAGLAQGQLSTVYSGHRNQNPIDRIVIKIADDESSNERLQQETQVLRQLHGEASPLRIHLPRYLNQFKTDDGRLGNILSYAEGYDLHAIRRYYPQGIDPVHSIWIFRRALSILGYAHSRGILHGNVEPAHLIVRPWDHNLVLVDWTCAVVNPARTGAGFQHQHPIYSAPEVAERKNPLPSADLYSLGLCMIYLLGGDPSTQQMPDSVDIRLQRFIKFFVRSSPIGRAQDAWEMFHKLKVLRDEIFGAHQFREFLMRPRP